LFVVPFPVFPVLPDVGFEAAVLAEFGGAVAAPFPAVVLLGSRAFGFAEVELSAGDAN
jgi:hypothetical protein